MKTLLSHLLVTTAIVSPALLAESPSIEPFSISWQHQKPDTIRIGARIQPAANQSIKTHANFKYLGLNERELAPNKGSMCAINTSIARGFSDKSQYITIWVSQIPESGIISIRDHLAYQIEGVEPPAATQEGELISLPHPLQWDEGVQLNFNGYAYFYKAYQHDAGQSSIMLHPHEKDPNLSQIIFLNEEGKEVICFDFKEQALKKIEHSFKEKPCSVIFIAKERNPLPTCPLNLDIKLPNSLLALMKGENTPLFSSISVEGDIDAQKLLEQLPFRLLGWELHIPSTPTGAEERLTLTFSSSPNQSCMLRNDDDSFVIGSESLTKSSQANGVDAKLHYHSPANSLEQFCFINISSRELPKSIDLDDRIPARLSYGDTLSELHPIAPDKGATFTFLGNTYSCNFDAKTDTLKVTCNTAPAPRREFRIFSEAGKIVAGNNFACKSENGSTRWSFTTKEAAGIQVQGYSHQILIEHPIKFTFDLPLLESKSADAD